VGSPVPNPLDAKRHQLQIDPSQEVPRRLGGPSLWSYCAAALRLATYRHTYAVGRRGQRQHEDVRIDPATEKTCERPFGLAHAIAEHAALSAGGDGAWLCRVGDSPHPLQKADGGTQLAGDYIDKRRTQLYIDMRR